MDTLVSPNKNNDEGLSSSTNSSYFSELNWKFQPAITQFAAVKKSDVFSHEFMTSFSDRDLFKFYV